MNFENISHLVLVLLLLTLNMQLPAGFKFTNLVANFLSIRQPYLACGNFQLQIPELSNQESMLLLNAAILIQLV